MMNVSLFLVKGNIGYVHDSEKNSYEADVAIA